MYRLEDLIQSMRIGRQQREAEQARQKATEINPLAVLAGLAVGGLTGGLGGATLGGLSGLGTSKAEGDVGVAKAGIGAYDLGDKFQDKLKMESLKEALVGAKSPSEFMKIALQISPEATIKGLIDQPMMGGNELPSNMLNAMFSGNQVAQPTGQEATVKPASAQKVKIPQFYLDDLATLGTPQEGMVAESNGKTFKFTNGEWVRIK